MGNVDNEVTTQKPACQATSRHIMVQHDTAWCPVPSPHRTLGGPELDRVETGKLGE